MACGVPVIGSDSGEIPNVIGDAGLVFPENNAAACASCLTAMTDPKRRDWFRQKGLERVDRLYSQSQIVKSTLNVYQRITG
jgi:glycosyltransferase involved in cell wall biosynthesis